MIISSLHILVDPEVVVAQGDNLAVLLAFAVVACILIDSDQISGDNRDPLILKTSSGW